MSRNIYLYTAIGLGTKVYQNVSHAKGTNLLFPAKLDTEYATLMNGDVVDA